MKNLDSKAKNYFFWSTFISFNLVLFFITLPFSFAIAAITNNFLAGILIFFGLFLLLAMVIIPVGIVFAAIWSELTYNNYSYNFTEDAVVIHKGVIIKTKTHIPYERIQNIDVRQGPILRAFNLNSVHIQTAGAGVVLGEGVIPAVALNDAEKIRDLLIKKSKGDKRK